MQGPQGFTSSEVSLGNRGYANQGFVTTGRPQVHTFHYDSAPVINGGGLLIRFVALGRRVIASHLQA